MPLAGIGLGALTGALRDGTTPTALLLAAEPLPAVLGICTVHVCFTRGRWAAGLAVAVGISAFILLSRITPLAPWPELPGRPPKDPATLAACGRRAIPPESFILALWTGANDANTVNRLTDVADEVVLVRPGIDLPTPAGGEYLSLPGDNVIWSRNGFAACGDTDTWPVGRHSALVYASPAPDVSVPLLVTDLPTLGPELNWEIADIGAFATATGGPLVVAGAGTFPTSFLRTSERLDDAGLAELRLPPNAPIAWGRLPLLALRSVNHVWVAPAWTGRGEVLDGGASWSAPVVLRLDATYQTP